ncbi:MAG: hypothetical protein RIQ89_214 [Bacteroidota bacterium]|jgi:D-3-phosphoglycerate dehydrogenase
MKTSYPKDKIKILLLEGIHKRAVALFKDAGYKQIETVKQALTPLELTKAIKDVHLLGIRSKTLVTDQILANANKLIAIGAFCIGTNQIAMEACNANGIAVFNAPFSNTRSVAELVIAEIIVLLRRLSDKNSQLHLGIWNKSSAQSYEARGKTLGIVGYGHIGSQVSVLAEAMGMRVIYFDVVPKLPLGNATACKTMEQLLEQSDVITYHVPGLPSTKNLLSEKYIRKMKPGVIVINNARGDIGNEKDIQLAIQAGTIAGFAADVFTHEPESNSLPFESPLRGLPNTFLTPHIGGSTEEAQENIGVDVATKMLQYLDTGSSMGSLTVPQINLPVQDGTHRLLHVHKNIPGVLSAINTLMSSKKANILGQYLQTNANIGYVVLDIDKKTGSSIIENLKKVKGTIKVRNLY